jgi:hypothetical protein
MSQTGQYQVAVGLNRSGRGNILVSSDYGSNWISRQDVSNGWQTIAMSTTGQYMTAIQASTFSRPRGNIWVSST